MSGTHLDHTHHSHLPKLAIYYSVTCSLIIIVAKTIGWLLSDSVSVFASLADSFLDIAASLINLFALNYAIQPPDNEHRFGHGKAEDLAVFTQASFFAISGLFVAVAAIKRFIKPVIIEQSNIAIFIMVFSILVTTGLVLFQRHVIKSTKSTVVEADHLHYFTDLLSNVATLATLIIASYFHFPIIDTIFAFAISLYIIWGSIKLFKKAIDNLLDHEFPDEEKAIIDKIIKSHPQIINFHDLKTRYSGKKPFIQFALEMNGEISLRKAHDLAHEVEHELLKEFPDAEIIIHQAPSE